MQVSFVRLLHINLAVILNLLFLRFHQFPRNSNYPHLSHSIQHASWFYEVATHKFSCNSKPFISQILPVPEQFKLPASVTFNSACKYSSLLFFSFDEEDLEHPEAYESAVLQVNNIPDEVLVGEAGKMQILVQLLDTFRAEGRKTLVFSQSCRMLNIIQKVITNKVCLCQSLKNFLSRVEAQILYVM